MRRVSDIFARVPISLKLSALVVLMVLATALMVNRLYLSGSADILNQQAIGDLRNETQSFSYPLRADIDQLRDDTRLLVSLQSTGNVVSQRSAKGPAGAALARTFAEMLRTHAHYTKIRVIGVADSGRELLKVERRRDRIVRSPAGELAQHENDRFFREALQTDTGQVYLSDGELYREDGKIVTPHLLVLRASVPLNAPDGTLFGIVIINMDLGKVLGDIQRDLSADRTLFVTNSQGDYLLNPDSSRLFATDLGTAWRIQRDYPGLPAALARARGGDVTLLPQDSGRDTVLAFHKLSYDPSDPDRFLGISVEARETAIVARATEFRNYGLLVSLGIVLVAAGVALLLLRALLRPLGRIADAVTRYRGGETAIELPERSPDEIGLIAREFRAMMIQKDQEDWVRESLVSTTRKLLGFKSLESFADSLMQALTATVGAEVGVLYISSNFIRRGLEETELLTLAGASGHLDRDRLAGGFQLGEGLVGQCAKDLTPRTITNVPAGYLTIATALASARPRELLLLPILFEERLAGVAELASLTGFTPAQRAFLERISYHIGISISSISARMHTEELLEEARQQAEELQRSEEELKTQQEELEASNEEMEERTRELEALNRQISETGERLAQASRYKSEFLANMSHELRTPLNSLLILARNLAQNDEGNLTAEQVEEAQVIHNGGLELLSLINDILDLSKVEAGKLNFVAEDMPPANIAARLERHFRPVAGETGLAFAIELDPALPAAIRTDPQRLEQILKNLLSNAFKFTRKGGVTVRIGVPGDNLALHRRTLAHGAAIAFAVSDTGIGIDPAKLTDIFEAFQQEDGSTDRHYGGTGLGLTIARKFAHLLGGEIQVESRKGAGSTFTLVLPLTWEAQAEPAPLPPLRPAIAPVLAEPLPLPFRQPIPAFVPDDRDLIGESDKVALIVEDDPAFARTLMKIARAHGYKCLAAGDGKNGLMLALEQPVSAVILDLTLPDIDGMVVLDQLKGNLGTRHIPVHIVTGRGKEEDLAHLRKGAIGYLTKPAAFEEIDRAFGRIEALLQAKLKTILVVEDDRKTQAAIKALLKKKAVEITCAGTGEAGLEHVAGQAYDCVILDLTLPDMTGFEWLEAVARRAGEARLPPVIVYTAKDLTEEEDRRLNQYTGSIVIKGASSAERLLDEVTLFLHSVESTLTKDQQTIIRMQHDPDKVLQARKVLLVDDDMRNTFALSKLLKKHGMDVVIADNGQMALDKLAEEPGIELVIMDIMMPVMDGYQAIQSIRARPALAALPVIALTARAMPEEQERCMAAGANDYLVKPVDVERLLTLLRVWLFRQDEAA